MDTSLIDLVPVLQRYVPPSEVFDRMQYSTFACGRLHPFLPERGIDTVIVTGSETDICVLSSVLSAVDLGYRVIVACDAICSSSDESHDALLGLYRRRFDLQIELAEVSEILETWTTGE